MRQTSRLRLCLAWRYLVRLFGDDLRDGVSRLMCRATRSRPRCNLSMIDRCPSSTKGGQSSGGGSPRLSRISATRRRPALMRSCKRREDSVSMAGPNRSSSLRSRLMCAFIVFVLSFRPLRRWTGPDSQVRQHRIDRYCGLRPLHGMSISIAISGCHKPALGRGLRKRCRYTPAPRS
jgi:hypothetical protein